MLAVVIEQDLAGGDRAVVTTAHLQDRRRPAAGRSVTVNEDLAVSMANAYASKAGFDTHPSQILVAAHRVREAPAAPTRLHIDGHPVTGRVIADHIGVVLGCELEDRTVVSTSKETSNPRPTPSSRLPHRLTTLRRSTPPETGPGWRRRQATVRSRKAAHLDRTAATPRPSAARGP